MFLIYFERKSVTTLINGGQDFFETTVYVFCFVIVLYYFYYYFLPNFHTAVFLHLLRKISQYTSDLLFPSSCEKGKEEIETKRT